MERLSKRMQLDSDIVESIYIKISEIDSVKKSWNYVHQSTPLPESIIKSTIITSSASSNRIEGNVLSDEEVEIIYNNLSKEPTSDDERDNIGYIQVLNIISECYKDITLSESNILYFHKVILGGGCYNENCSNAVRGYYRNVEARDRENKIIGIIFDPTPPYLVQKEMSELIAWYHNSLGKKHPLILIANFIFEFLAIHPFIDGNGRMSRLLTNLLLLQNGYSFCLASSHERVIEKNKADYYLALRKTQSSWKTGYENIYPWLDYFLDVVKEQCSDLLS